MGKPPRHSDRDLTVQEDYSGRLFALLQRFLPQHFLSRVLAGVAEAKLPCLKNFLIRRFVAAYGVNLEAAQNSDIKSYRSFNEFFTRALKAGARALDPAPHILVSPADGTLSQFGIISGGQLIQAKNHRYTTQALLGDAEAETHFDGGRFATIYLAPKDYHRVHMPLDGKLVSTHYIPGRLFSVNAKTARHVPELFARNERLVCIFDTNRGRLAVILVGAMFVAGIETVWQTRYSPGTPEAHQAQKAGLVLVKGAEMGRFRFGSTVILLCPKDLEWDERLIAGATVSMGQSLGYFDSGGAHDTAH